MTKKIFFSITLIAGLATGLAAQSYYRDSMFAYQQRYADRHEVVQGKDKEYFRFFVPMEMYQVTADIEMLPDGKLVTMETSGWLKKTFREYALARFKLRDTTLSLTIYKPQMLPGADTLQNYLFLPFTDATCGDESYGAGRYLDLDSRDIHNGKMVIDFNKTYNPYCAFVTGKYNCPVPPATNHLPVAIRAGEKKFGLPPQKAAGL